MDIEGSDEDQDEIVQELDVYFAPDSAPQLHLLQFPGKRADDVDAIVEPVSARLKPRHNMLQLELPLPAAHQQSFHRTDTRRFDSQTIPVRTHLCLAQLVEASDGTGRQQLHLVPLQHVHQMRPNFAHVDAHDMFGDDDDDANAAAGGADDANQKNKPVTFQRKESERAALARMNTYAFQKASQDAEAWTELEVVSSKLQRQTLESKTVVVDGRASIWKSDVTTAGYVQTLNYGMSSSAATEAVGTGGAPTSTTAEKTFGNTAMNSRNRKVEMVSKLTTFLKTGSPIPFSILARQFPKSDGEHGDDPEPLLLEALSACAVLVRGNWCLHSKFLPRFGKIRTLLLLLLHEDGWIDRRKLWDQVYDGSKIHPNQLLALLQQIGKQRPGGHGWILQIADDDRFLREHPEIVTVHDEYWTRQRKRFRRELALYNKGMNDNDD